MGPGFESLKVHQRAIASEDLSQTALNFACGECGIVSCVRIPEGAPARKAGQPISAVVQQKSDTFHTKGCSNKVEKACQKGEKVSVFNAEGPPVPIPNTEVKLCSAENTCRATGREDRSMLTQ